MGEVFYKYDSLNLYLYQFNQSSGLGGSGTTQSPSNSLVDVKIKGLPFIYNSYNTVTGINNNEVFLTSYLMNNASQTSFGIITPLYNPSIVTFDKGSAIVDINITMKRTLDHQYPTVTNNMVSGTFVFMFKIYGIPKRDNIITNGLRML